MNHSLRWFAISLLITATGCSQSGLIERIAPQEVSSAKVDFDLLRHHQFEQVESILDPSIKDANIRQTLTNMAVYIPDEEPISVKTVGAYVNCRGNKCETTISLEYEFPSQWVLARVVTQKDGATSSVTGFHVSGAAQSLEETNRFTLFHKSAAQYIILILAALLPIFSLYQFVQCIRMKNLRRKWLWIIFILTGVGRIAVVWTTGQIGLSLFYIQLFSASATAQFFGPWIISISLPWGAILFWAFPPKTESDPSTLVSEGDPSAVENATPENVDGN